MSDELLFNNFVGSYLLSGGYECVLVKWQYNSHYKTFLPRLGSPINHVTCSSDNLMYATCHQDNGKSSTDPYISIHLTSQPWLCSKPKAI